MYKTFVLKNRGKGTLEDVTLEDLVEIAGVPKNGKTPVKGVDYFDGAKGSDGVYIKGIATSTNAPTPWTTGQPNLFEKYEVLVEATLTNYKDSSNNPITVTAADLAGNLVFINVSNGVSKKEIKSLLSGGGGTSEENKLIASLSRPSFNLLNSITDFQKGSWNTSGLWTTSNNAFSTIKLPIGTFTEKSLSGVSSIGSTIPRILYWDASGNLISYLSGTLYKDSSPSTFPIPPLNATTYAINLGTVTNIGLDLQNSPYMNTVMFNEGSIKFPFERYGLVLKSADENENYYVSPSGSDTNVGSFFRPFKTIDFALTKLPNKKIILLEGDYTTTKAISGKKILGLGKCRLIYGKLITSAILVSGKVWKATEDISIKPQDYFLWQHDIKDPKSLIPQNQIHTIQKGATHRLESTRIKKVNSIAEIEASTDLSWFHDGITFYFSKTTDSDLSVNPIVIPGLAVSGANTYLDNLSILYSGLNQSSNGILSVKNSTVLYCNQDPISASAGQVIVENCNIGGCYNNGLGYLGVAVAIEKNNWVHDCFDEGSSGHGLSTITRIGGYYENNDSGITDVGNATSYNENLLLMNNTHGGFTFTFYAEGINHKGSAKIFNCATDSTISANITGRVIVANSKAKLGIGANVEII